MTPKISIISFAIFVIFERTSSFGTRLIRPNINARSFAMTAKSDFYRDAHFDFKSEISDQSEAFDMDKIVKCAESGEGCSVEEMSRMVRELENLNKECENLDGTDCSVEAVENRNVLKKAISLQHELALVRDEISKSDSMRSLKGNGEECKSRMTDHAFGRYIDYRKEAEYESH
mmetsp:Transcript_13077/g.15699  ORF Transcript_13077/g.15699 Transcript_13077/m.15699 type:complete len:174 (-) Transcript_13077:89-610(-)